jgi:3-hydroxybutyryl-CoA dehydrogenase
MTMTADDVTRIAVVGAGQMGAQIALQAALHGFRVTLNDLSTDLLQGAIKKNRPHLERRVAKGQMTRDAMQATLDRLRLEPDLDRAVGEADFVIEAIVERLGPKTECFGRLDRAAPAHAILATNSSTLGNSLLAPATRRPDKCVNMHFFYPPLVMRLVEVVKGPETSEETVQITAEVTRRMGREPVILRKEVPGFVANRILYAMRKEAYFLLEQGVAGFADIDKAVRLGLNHPMGPFELADLSGLDVGYSAQLEASERSKDPRDRPPRALRVRVERGDLGRKTGRGFYDYTSDPPAPTPD